MTGLGEATAAASATPLRRLIGHLAAALQLLPDVIERRGAELREEVRAALREEQARVASADRARELLALPEWLNTAQAAQLLGCSASHIYAELRRERERPADRRPLTSCSRPTGRSRGRGEDREFSRDALLAHREGRTPVEVPARPPAPARRRRAAPPRPHLRSITGGAR